MRLFLQVLLVSICCACQTTTSNQPPVSELTEVIQYAEGFKIEWHEGVKIITVNQPWAGAQTKIRYALIPKHAAVPDNLVVDQVIRTPISSLVVTSTTHLPALDLLKAQDLLIGFPQTQYITTPSFVAAHRNGTLKELGSANGLNIELLLTNRPDLVMTYQSGADFTQLDALNATQIPTVLNADFLEPTPLGRAEWIKFTGHLIGQEQVADSIFRAIEAQYQQIRALTESIVERPSVFSGCMYGGTWYAPGGKSFVAQLIHDAGGLYTWQHRAEAGSLELSFEAVLAQDQNTAYWIGMGVFNSSADLLAADQRYTNFEAFQNHQMYNYHKRLGENGGYEYLEMGVARPDIVLKDLVHILHPDLISQGETYFFKAVQ